MFLQEIHDLRVSLAPGWLCGVNFLHGGNEFGIGGVSSGHASVINPEDRPLILDEDVIEDRVVGTAGNVDAAPISHEDVAIDERSTSAVVGIVAAHGVMDEIIADHDAAECPVEPGVEGPRVRCVVGAAVHLVELVDVVVAAIEESVARRVVDQVVSHIATDDSLVPLGIVNQTGGVNRRRVLGFQYAVMVQVVVDDVVA